MPFCRAFCGDKIDKKDPLDVTISNDDLEWDFPA